MIARLFPRQMDNGYQGQRLAVWLLGLLVALKLVIALNSMINTEMVAAGADGFPLDRYGPEGAHAVLMLFATGATAQLTLGLLGVAALVRYRAMVPLVFLLFGIEFVTRRLVLSGYAVERAGDSLAPLFVNGAFALLLAAGLLLSLWQRRGRG
jgi:hypothetical protein